MSRLVELKDRGQDSLHVGLDIGKQIPPYCRVFPQESVFELGIMIPFDGMSL